MENHSRDQVLGSSAAPYETRLAAACGTASDYEQVGSPSLPNYLGATGGDVFGVHDDASPSSHPLTSANIFRQVRAAGGTARSYEEGMPRPCALESSGRYAVKHNPAAYFVGGDDRDACTRDDVTLDAFATDLANGTLPSFAFVTPDLCNDTHDCPVATGDAFLAKWVDAIVSSPSYRDGSTVVFVVWDEDSPMPFVVVSPTTRPGTVVAARTDHYGLLRTTEELLGLDEFLGGAATATSLRAPFGL